MSILLDGINTTTLKPLFFLASLRVRASETGTGGEENALLAPDITSFSPFFFFFWTTEPVRSLSQVSPEVRLKRGFLGGGGQGRHGERTILAGTSGGEGNAGPGFPALSAATGAR